MIAASSFGQRRLLTSAWNFMRDGFLADAKEAIDKAAEHPDTKDNYRTFWYKGQIYQELSVTDNPRYKKLCDESCLDIAFENYIMALRKNFLDPENQKIDFEDELGIMKFVKLLQDQNTRYEDSNLLMDVLLNRFPALSNAFINRGVDKFQVKHDYEAALSDFEQALFIAAMSFKLDTQLLYFSSLAAFRSQQYDKAIEYNKNLIDMKYGETNEEKIFIYQSLAKSYEMTERYDKMIETLEKGISTFPELSYPLIIDIFNYYVNSEQIDEAYKYISLAIEKNPEDAQFYVIKGALLEELKRKDEAKIEYENALAKDSMNFDANYSLGAFYYNTAVDTIQWADDNIVITNFAAHEKIKKIADVYFEQALPYLEKSLEIQAENLNVLNTLRVVYYRLQKMDEYAEIQKTIDSMNQ